MGNKAVSRAVSGAIKAACFWLVAAVLVIARQMPFPALREFALPTTWDGLAQLLADGILCLGERALMWGRALITLDAQALPWVVAHPIGLFVLFVPSFLLAGAITCYQWRLIEEADDGAVSGTARRHASPSSSSSSLWQSLLAT